MAIFNGTIYVVDIAGTALPDQTEGSISLSMETRDATTKGSSGNRELLESTRSGSISVSALYADDAAYGVNDLMTVFSNRTSVTVKFSTEVSGDDYWSATAYLTSLEVSAGMEDSATFSASFEITGAITFPTVA